MMLEQQTLATSLRFIVSISAEALPSKRANYNRGSIYVPPGQLETNRCPLKYRGKPERTAFPATNMGRNRHARDDEAHQLANSDR